MEKLMQTLIDRIEEGIDRAKKIAPDVPLCDQMDDLLDDSDLKIALIKFQMNRAVDFPPELLFGTLSPADLARAVMELPRVPKSGVPTFLKKKKLELAKLAHEMSSGIRVSF